MTVMLFAFVPTAEPTLVTLPVELTVQWPPGGGASVLLGALAGYLVPELVLPVLLSRGCRWRACSFCAHNFSFG